MGVDVGKLRLSNPAVIAILERHARDTATRAAQLTTEAARQFAPVSRVHRTGPGRGKRIRDAIEPSVRRVATGVQATIKPSRRDAFYAGFLENGTVNMEAQPFMEPARAMTEPEAERIITTGADQAAAELARLL